MEANQKFSPRSGGFQRISNQLPEDSVGHSELTTLHNREKGSVAAQCHWNGSYFEPFGHKDWLEGSDQDTLCMGFDPLVVYKTHFGNGWFSHWPVFTMIKYIMYLNIVIFKELLKT